MGVPNPPFLTMETTELDKKNIDRERDSKLRCHSTSAG
jgi:hypothetical protein